MKEQALRPGLYAIGMSFVAMAGRPRACRRRVAPGPSPWHARRSRGARRLRPSARGGAPGRSRPPPHRRRWQGDPVAYPLLPWFADHGAGATPRAALVLNASPTGGRRSAAGLPGSPRWRSSLWCEGSTVTATSGPSTATTARSSSGCTCPNTRPASRTRPVARADWRPCSPSSSAPPRLRAAWRLLFGQTAFFFYLLHVHLLEGAAHALGLFRQEGIAGTVLAAGEPYRSNSSRAVSPLRLRNPSSVMDRCASRGGADA